MVIITIMTMINNFISAFRKIKISNDKSEKNPVDSNANIKNDLTISRRIACVRIARCLHRFDVTLLLCTIHTGCVYVKP